MKKLAVPGLAALGLIGLMTFATPALAMDNYKFDTDHTQIFFSVNHLGFSNSTGKFLKFDGGFSFDETAPEKSNVDVTIYTDSIDMDSKAWDDHLKNEDFFHVEKYPTMTFKSTDIEVTGDNTGKLTGDLTLLGKTNPVTLDVTFNKLGVHPYSGKMIAGFSATGTLKRSDFGMGYGLPNIGDEVTLRIEVEGIRQGDDATEDTAE